MSRTPCLLRVRPLLVLIEFRTRKVDCALRHMRNADSGHGQRSSRQLIITGLLLASLATAQNRPRDTTKTWRGTWIATFTSRTFRGRWWASLVGDIHNAASGSWTLLSDSNQIMLEGTWSAKKSAQGWQGNWSATVGRGAPFRGTWTSNAPDLTAKTLEDLLQSTINRQVSGAWRSGRMQGNWWLQGP
jgi:hypothetical protein